MVSHTRSVSSRSRSARNGGASSNRSNAFHSAPKPQNHGSIADSEPNLEIENGNIIGAGHASSVGRFDDEELFYLQSRGIPETEARKLVVRGFFGELVEEIGIPAISEHLMNVIDMRLARGENDAIAQVLEEK